MIGQGGFQLQLCGGEFHGEHRIKRLRVGCLFELLEHALGLLHIEHGDGRVAVGTSRVGFQVDGRATVGAIHKLNVLPQLVDLVTRQRMDEILFFQELEKTDEVAVIGRASPIRERHVSLQVVRQVQRRGAPRTVKRVRKRRLSGCRVFADEFHELQCGAGRELQALEMIEPERLATGAHIDGDLSTHAAVQRHRSHFGSAAGALHRQTL